MKKTVSYLILAHIVATFFAVVSHASVYTMVYLYACQTALLLIVLTVQSLRSDKTIFKLFSLVQALIFGLILTSLFFFIGKLQGTTYIYENYVKTTVNLGSIHYVPLIVGSLVFLINYWLDDRYKRKPKPKKSFDINMQSFFIIFCNIAAFILIMVSAVMFTNTTLGIIVIAIIKVSLDVGLLFLAIGLTHSEGPVQTFIKRK